MRRLLCMILDLIARMTCPVCGRTVSWRRYESHLRLHEQVLPEVVA